MKEYIMSFRKYQKSQFSACHQNWKNGIQRSSYYASTGAGKTVIFTKLIEKILKSESKLYKKILVVYPRIALSRDQANRSEFQNFKVPFHFFDSGTATQSMTNDDDSTNAINRSTTSTDELSGWLSDESTDSITFTSYKSLPKIADWDIFDMIICDEAHNLMERENRKVLDMFKSPVMFFTATPITTDASDDLCMSDVTKFGINDSSWNIEPATLIGQGYSVMPTISLAKITTDESGAEHDYATTIGEVFKDQAARVDKSMVHKMLVALPNTTRFEEINDKIADIREATGTELNVYTIAAGRNTFNGSAKGMKKRDKVLQMFKNDPSPCIVVHCDTLSEGIDIDGLTGAFIARGLSQSKFLQTIGRVTRPFKQDFKEDGTPKARRFRKKQEAFIAIAVVDNNGKLDTSDVERWTKALTTAGYPTVDGKGILETSEIIGVKEDAEELELMRSAIVLATELQKQTVAMTAEFLELLNAA